MLLHTPVLVVGLAWAVHAFPQQTSSPTVVKRDSTTTITTSASTSTITSLVCSDGSTLTTTSDCTYPTITYSYCYSQPPPLTCPPSSFPVTHACGECIVCTNCFPVPTTTSTCDPSRGQSASTVTSYVGTVAPETTTTTILGVDCWCPQGEYASWSSNDSWCMPISDCPSGLTTASNHGCVCGAPNQTPVYPPGNTGVPPTGCADITTTTTATTAAAAS